MSSRLLSFIKSVLVKKNEVLVSGRELYKTSLNIFTNRKNCDIIVVPNELNNRADRYIFLCGITIPFFVILLNESIW